MMQANGRAATLKTRPAPGRVRRDFPVLRRRAGEKPLVYLDSAATAQKPNVVIERIRAFYSAEYAKNDTPYRLGKHATEMYEASRAAAAKFLNARSPDEIVFTRNTTEAINLVANGFGRKLLEPGDEVLITACEHHSNIVPWHMACEQAAAKLLVAPLHAGGDLDVERLGRMITDRTRIVAVTHISNVLGGLEPVEEVVRVAHARGVPVLVDGAQAAPHVPVDVRANGCDFYAFSGHKTYGPSGVGVLYGTTEWLEKLPPSLGGEPMAADVTFDGWTPKPPPEKFSAGVPALASTVSLGTALDYMTKLGRPRIARHVRGLATAAAKALAEIEGVRIIGNVADRVSVVTFTIDGVEPEAAAEFLDRSESIAVRAGHLSARPLLRTMGLEGAVRASFGVYNTPAEIDVLAEAVGRCVRAKARHARAGK